MKTKVARESLVLAAICLADLITTLWFVHHEGASEGNPLMNYYLEQGVIPFIAAKCVLVLMPLAVLEWARRRKPRFVQAMLRVGIVLYLGMYGAVVWRINAPGHEPPLSDAHLSAIRRWAALPPTREEISQLREQLVSVVP